MYSTRRINKNVADAYITVGDPYTGDKQKLPGR
jgi:hypothetical protein